MMNSPTASIPQESIVSETPVQTAMAKARAKSVEARIRRKETQVALKAQLDVGVYVYPDSPPGVGWVLERIGYAKLYFRDKQRCESYYWMLVSKGIG